MKVPSDEHGGRYSDRLLVDVLFRQPAFGVDGGFAAHPRGD
jgi:hypothetical protein